MRPLPLSVLTLAVVLGGCGAPPASAPAEPPPVVSPAAPVPGAPAPPTGAPPTAAAQSAFPFRLTQTIAVPSPLGIAVDPQGNLYAVDTSNALVHKFDVTGAEVASWGGQGGDDGQFLLNPPEDWSGPLLTGGFIAAGPDDRLYISDIYNFRVQVFDTEGQLLDSWELRDDAGQPLTPGPLVIDQAGDVLVATLNGLDKYSSAGELLARWTFGDELLAVSPGATSPDGTIYTVDVLTSQAAILNADGSVRRRWGSPGEGEGQFTGPADIALDDQQNIYIVGNSPRLQMFDPEGRYLGEWSPGDAAGAAEVRLNNLAFGPDGRLFVADSSGNVVYILERETP